MLHLMFGAFIVGVPIFASIVEIIGWRTGDARYDRLAHEFTGDQADPQQREDVGARRRRACRGPGA